MPPKPPEKPAGPSAAQLRRAKRCLEELVRRNMEALKIYQPLPKIGAFHRSTARERIVVGSNRAGKTQGAAAEVAWAVTGTHPHLPYPKENGLCYAVGYDHKHIGEVMWPKLSRPGSFKIIKDERTGQWRPVRPDAEYDAAYRERWKDSPPFLPPRFVNWAKSGWESKKDDIPARTVLKNGWRIRWFSSKGKPQKGSAIDLGWPDEEIENELWIPELEARCIDKRGRLFWSFTPEIATELAYTMHIRANSPQKEWDIDEFHLLITENFFLSDEAKREFRKQLRTQREIDTKWHGKFALGGFAVYPEYNQEVHHVPPFAIPDEWNHYMIVDPGVQVCAVLFAAVPPPRDENGKVHGCAGEIHFYDEIYIRRCSASIFGERVAAKMGRMKRGGFLAFIIDEHGSNNQDTGHGRTIREQYSDALRDNGVYSRETGDGFMPGCDDIAAREGMFRSLLEPSLATAEPRLRVHHHRLPNFDWEMEQQFYRKGPDGLVTDKRQDKNNHIVTCGEYFAAYDPEWVPARPPDQPLSPAYLAWKKHFAKKRESGTIVLGPPT